jgi:hypothetical protein
MNRPKPIPPTRLAQNFALLPTATIMMIIAMNSSSPPQRTCATCSSLWPPTCG